MERRRRVELANNSLAFIFLVLLALDIAAAIHPCPVEQVVHQSLVDGGTIWRRVSNLMARVSPGNASDDGFRPPQVLHQPGVFPGEPVDLSGLAD